jgi:hypothetical protein
MLLRGRHRSAACSSSSSTPPRIRVPSSLLLRLPRSSLLRFLQYRIPHALHSLRVTQLDEDVCKTYATAVPTHGL